MISANNNSVAIGSVPNVLNIDVYKSRNFYMGGSGAPFDGFNSMMTLQEQQLH